MSYLTWFDEAKRSLALAEPIVNEVSERLEVCQRQVQSASSRWTRLVFVDRELNAQHSRMEAILSKLHDKFDSVNIDRSKLANKVAELQQINVERAIHKQDSKTLASFIDTDAIDQWHRKCDLLEEKTKLRQVRYRKLSGALRQNYEAYQKSTWGLEEARWRSELETCHESHAHVTECAQTMAKMLESLTIHYDKCLCAVELSQDVSKKDELSEMHNVLRDDADQVADVLAEMSNCLEEFKHAQVKIHAVSNGLEGKYVELKQHFDRCDLLATNYLYPFRDYHVNFIRQSQIAMKVKEDLIADAENLCQRFHLFQESYYSLCLEVSRRHRARDSIIRLASSMQNALDDAVKEETEARSAFLHQRGAHIPVDLWPQVMQVPRKLKVEVPAEELPELPETLLQRAERVLARQQVESA